MKKNTLNIGFLSILLLFVGVITGFTFGIYRGTIATQLITEPLVAKIANTPASPIVTESSYNEEKGELNLSLINTGVMPIKLLTKSMILTPKGEKNIALGLEIPLNIVLGSGQEINLKVKLNNENKTKFKVGDIITTTLTYTYPVSNDIYSVSHIFIKSEQKNKIGNNINRNGNNNKLQQNYKKQLEEKNNNNKNK